MYGEFGVMVNIVVLFDGEYVVLVEVFVVVGVVVGGELCVDMCGGKVDVDVVFVGEGGVGFVCFVLEIGIVGDVFGVFGGVFVECY